MIRRTLRRIFNLNWSKLKRRYAKLLSEPTFTAQKKRYAHHDIGEWTYGSPRILSWGEGAKLHIGRFCSIADGVVILLGGEHNTDWVTTYPFNVLFEDAVHFRGHPKSKGDVTIGNDVWIGMDSLILSGVTIGNGAVVAACSVVTQDIPSYAIVAGNPARLVRYRFPESVIRDLNTICWWDWPIERIKESWPLLLTTNVTKFTLQENVPGTIVNTNSLLSHPEIKL